MRLTDEQIERVNEALMTMPREELVAALRGFDEAPFPIDFTDEYLARQPTEWLRHILYGLCLHCGTMPKRPSHTPPLAAAA